MNTKKALYSLFSNGKILPRHYHGGVILLLQVLIVFSCQKNIDENDYLNEISHPEIIIKFENKDFFFLKDCEDFVLELGTIYWSDLMDQELSYSILFVDDSEITSNQSTTIAVDKSEKFISLTLDDHSLKMSPSSQGSILQIKYRFPTESLRIDDTHEYFVVVEVHGDGELLCRSSRQVQPLSNNVEKKIVDLEHLFPPSQEMGAEKEKYTLIRERCLEDSNLKMPDDIGQNGYFDIYQRITSIRKDDSTLYEVQTYPGRFVYVDTTGLQKSVDTPGFISTSIVPYLLPRDEYRSKDSLARIGTYQYEKSDLSERKGKDEFSFISIWERNGLQYTIKVRDCMIDTLNVEIVMKPNLFQFQFASCNELPIGDESIPTWLITTN